ncbi:MULTISPECIES: hypothetical protein [Clostridium]|uniref:Uncharacterized protein n=1 Tax=Clostridium senegalense TaxID=1465809 RepID=A0A6M0H6Q7_9CLOT|nr:MULTISPECIES: hypothetical protein [Clostridium]NEU06028.1 hypothetical protein [Clostridium senegalense]
MKIIIKENMGRKFIIPIPMFCISIAINCISLAGKYGRKNKNSHSKINEESLEILKNIDKRILKKAFKDLKKSCKGMVIVDIEEHDGSYVKIII